MKFVEFMLRNREEIKSQARNVKSVLFVSALNYAYLSLLIDSKRLQMESTTSGAHERRHAHQHVRTSHGDGVKRHEVVEASHASHRDPPPTSNGLAASSACSRSSFPLSAFSSGLAGCALL